MTYHFKDRKELADFVNSDILIGSEAMELLNISRPRLNKLVKDGRIIPLKQEKSISLFLREDVEKLAEELAALRKKYRPFE
ncbi:helix-turn-helix domain-containing protein [Bacillus sp. BP-3]|uniref:helix-turn-helix domain-containing protein n=1 Tax=Bacillus sp. BP-3 TaxID=3022773 RepID=UPI002330E7C4|nr:helix-turn-helix domain-containing protein [Bacillus sp. BP-3]MDC2863799.1 helix-turn-helix domain-containing protein [Bacillus sp. BP-3]